MKLFKPKIALITGGGSGIGQASALHFARKGWKVVILGRNKNRLLKVASLHKNIFCFQGDLTHPATARKLIDFAKQKFGTLNLLIHAAGLFEEGIPLIQLSLGQWNKLMTINATGTFLVNREFAKEVQRQKNGIIVNIASLAGLSEYILPNRVAYNVSKHVVVAISCTLDQEIHPYNGRVWAVCPGLVIDTPMTNSLLLKNPQIKKLGLTSAQVARVLYRLVSKKPKHTVLLLTRKDGLKPVLSFSKRPTLR